MRSNRHPGGGNALSMSRRVRRAVRKESWGRTALQLAWTAGPVTYLALQGGYFLSYGESAPPNLLIYFAAYTLVAGILAVVVRLIYNATHGQEVEEAERTLRDVVAELPVLLLGARDAALRSYEPEDTRRVAAYHLLSDPDASHYAVGFAMEELGVPAHLSETFRRIAAFGRHGLLTIVQREYAQHREEIDGLVNRLGEISPDLAARVSERAQGKTPSRVTGRQRWDGFLERALSAGSEDDLDLLTGGDAQEIIGLTIELLVGRVFPLLIFRYQGERRTHAAWVELANARREYRARIRTRNSRLRTVADALADRLEYVLPSIARLTDVGGMLHSVTDALDRLAGEIEKRPLSRRASDRRSNSSSQLRGAIARYAELEKAADLVDKAYRRLRRAYEAYDTLLGNELRESEEAPSLSAGKKQTGVWIDEQELSLPDSRKRAVARELKSKLLAAGLWRREVIEADIATFRELAVGIVAMLEKHLPLHRMEVQQAIEFTRAPYFGGMGPGVSSEFRAGRARALVDELDTNMREYGLRLVRRLFRFHGLRLTEQTQRILQEKLGVAESDLEHLASLSREPTSALPSEPVRVPPMSASLRSRLEKLRR